MQTLRDSRARALANDLIRLLGKNGWTVEEAKLALTYAHSALDNAMGKAIVEAKKIDVPCLEHTERNEEQ